eukprot:TRINITY_DN1335_c0_g1_i1.p1 TRINITY_DN1335_c0_g1~~TRINITY_DN1335_c0_g1_i1.p1  ORF type:complete len:498 (+),score=80.51 TRINITY_DN1335_c0_g1_i1:171-1664(+)
MGQNQSRNELLYQQVEYGNIEGIKALRREGAGLEWIDREGKTPLIVACLKPDHLHVAKTLIELGANVNAYRPGSHGGTPLHHAAKRGLDQVLSLLLSYEANPLIMNDDCQTPLDLARSKGHWKVVRAIENHICVFSGWLRELYGPGFLEALAPQWVSRKIWAVIIPCGSRNLTKPLKFELAIYSGLQDAQPRTVIPLGKVKIEEPKFNMPDPTVVIFDKVSRTKFKFLSANEGDKHQLQWFFDACRGMPQGMRPPLQPNDPTTAIPATAPIATPEDVELAIAINASIQSAMEERPPLFPVPHLSSGTSNTNGWDTSADNASHNSWGPPDVPPPLPKKGSSGWADESASGAHNGWDVSETGSSSNPPQHNQSQLSMPGVVVPLSQSSDPPTAASIPSAPPIPEESTYAGPIAYPSIDSSPVDISMPTMEIRPGTSEPKGDPGTSSSCVICFDAPVEGACIPCGHMAGCISCLNEIKDKKWGCPVCRAEIDQVIKIYAV